MSEPTDTGEARAMAGLARGGLANLVGTGVSAACQFAVVLIVTRLFSATDAGALFAATAIFLIVVAVVELGLDQGLVRFIAWYRARSESADLGALLRVALVPAALASLIGVLCVAAGADAMAVWFNGATGEVATALRVLAVAVPFAAATDVLLAATRGFGVMWPTVVVERILRAILQPLAIVAVGIGGGGLIALTVAWVAPYVLSAGAAAVALRRLWLVHARRPRTAERADTTRIGAIDDDPGATDRVTIARTFWSYTSARAVARVFQVLLQRVDIVLVAALLGTRDAAIYTAATRCIAIGQLLNLAIQQVIQPRLAELLAVEEHRLAQLVLRRTTTALVALAWPGYLAIIAVSPWLMSIFGPGYEDGTATLVILSVAMLIATAAGPLDVVLLMAGRSTISLVNMLAGLIVNVAGCLVLLPLIGLDGAAWAWAAAIVVRNGLGVLVTRSALKLTAGSRDLAVVSAWAVTTCGVPAIVAALVGVRLVVVAVLLALGGVVYGAFVLRHRDLLGGSPVTPSDSPRPDSPRLDSPRRDSPSGARAPARPPAPPDHVS